MRLSRKTLIFLTLILTLLSSALADTKNTPQKEIGMKKPTLEGLEEFHEVLAPIWHKAYPDKDFKAIREAVPGFQEKMELILRAELPGFYRERNKEFEGKRGILARSVEELENKANGDDNQALLVATENLHTAFARLAFFFAPRVRELEEFHLILYPLWHKALPDKSFQTIRDSAPVLQEKMDALMKANLPDNSKGIEPNFIEKRNILKKSVSELIKACDSKNNKKLEEKLVKMHKAYMELDQVFDGG